MFIFTSSSFPFNFIFISLSGPQFSHPPAGGCVCVNHLKRWKTSIFAFLMYLPVLFTLFQFKQGGAEHSGNCTQRSYPLVLEAESDQLCVPAFKCRLWISWWRPAKPRTGMSFSNIFKPNFNLRTSFWCSPPVRFSQSVREVNFASNQGYGEVPFWLLLNSSLLFKSILSGITGLFFARKIHSTSEFAMTVLSKCVQ